MTVRHRSRTYLSPLPIHLYGLQKISEHSGQSSQTPKRSQQKWIFANILGSFFRVYIYSPTENLVGSKWNASAKYWMCWHASNLFKKTKNLIFMDCIVLDKICVISHILHMNVKRKPYPYRLENKRMVHLSYFIKCSIYFIAQYHLTTLIEH